MTLIKPSANYTFDPNAAGRVAGQIFGLPFEPDECQVVLLPVPWEVTVCYGQGTSNGPNHIIDASMQMDLFSPEFPDLWQRGIAMLTDSHDFKGSSDRLREKSARIISACLNRLSIESDGELTKILNEINQGCAEMVDKVEQITGEWLDQGKIVGLVGGDHSTPLGFIRALAKRHRSFGILHIDSHSDLRVAFEGFTYSHASIMYNALLTPQVSKLVQVAIRDYCEAESTIVEQSAQRVVVFTDAAIQSAAFQGQTWDAQCEAIISTLPEKVYVSFDIDGLDPALCPNTGTPVPGGLSFQQATYLLSKLKDKREIIGFDLVEVAPGDDEWNGNVGARLLYHLCGVAAYSGISRDNAPSAS
jgi:agmatinase